MIVHRLRKENNSFYITRPRVFSPLLELKNYIEPVFSFAYGMTFGKKGEHREYRTGGQAKRKNGELFINTFQGKLAEFGIYKFFYERKIELRPPDLGMWERGKWDSTDLVIGNNKINIKSAAFFSNLLLLERQDWDNYGNYIPNIENGGAQYDFFVLSRIKPDGKGLLRKAGLFFSDSAPQSSIYDLIADQKWEFDIPGFCSFNEIKTIIKEGLILPQNSLLNGKTKIDAENYYCQAGDMHPIDEILKMLN